MADCCSTSSGFPNASTAASLATNYSVVWEEICMLQQGILSAVSQCQSGGGQMSTIIGGNTPMTFISGLNSVVVSNGGSGYYEDTPAILFNPPITPWTGPSTPTATLTTNGGAITNITITSGSSGWGPVKSTAVVNSLSGSGASISPSVDANGAITGFTIINGGSNYQVNDTITATRAVPYVNGYVDAVATVSTIGVSGQIEAIAIYTAGSGYQDAVATVSIVSTLNNSLYPVGTGFFGTVNTDVNGTVISVTINSGGQGYSTLLPQLNITDSGVGAETTVVLSGTSVQSITVDESGNGYTSSATGQVVNPSTGPTPSVYATVVLNISANTYGTNPQLYYQVIQGTATNAAIQNQISSVESYFQGLGYTISTQTNPESNNTFQWLISW